MMIRRSIERTTTGFRLNVKRVALSVLAVTFVASAAFGQGRSGNAPGLGNCDHLMVPAGNQLFFRVYAEGFQIYRWSGTSWVFVAPEAVLSANPGGTGVVGLHYAGPTWESNSGSKVIGSVDERCTVSTSDIQWLRLHAVTTEGPGIFQDVTFILRLYTSGGVAPTTPGTTVGQIARVPYSTEYYFYR
jgi:Protein of unknown function (DUF3455)